MNNINNKALQFLTALLDVYRDEENRESYAFPKLNMVEGYFTEDLTAILIAFNVLCQETTGFDGDLIEFTHVLNKLAIQYIMDDRKESQ